MLKHKLTLALSIGMLAFMGLAVFMLYDEPLSDDTRYLLSLVEEPRENDAYYLLIGLGVAEELDPIETGKACVHEGSDLCKPGAWDFDSPLNQCPEKDLNCFLDTDISEALEYYSSPIARMQAFLASDDYHPVVSPDITFDSVRVDWGLAFRAMSLRVAQHLQAGEVSDLEELLAQLRQHLVLTDTTLGKLSMLHWTATTLDALVELNAGSEVMPLTQEERAFDRVYAYDYASIYSNLDMFSMIPKDEMGIGSKLVYKPHLTANLLAKLYREMIESTWLVDDATRREFASSLRKYPKYEYLRNSVGVLLVQTAAPSVMPIANLDMRIDNAIAELNHQRSLHQP